MMLQFTPNFNLNQSLLSSPNIAEYGYSGDIGNGDHGATGCFSFNITGASFGCDSEGPACDFSFTGFRYNSTTGLTSAITQQQVIVPSCPALANCTLTPVTLDQTFQDIDSVRINVTVSSEPKIWWMDDIQLGWTNNTCTAGTCRSNHIAE